MVEAVDVSPEVDGMVEFHPVVVRVVTVLEVLLEHHHHVHPALPKLPVPLEGLGHGGGEAVDVLLYLVQVDHANIPEVVPAEMFPETESIWRRRNRDMRDYNYIYIYESRRS